MRKSVFVATLAAALLSFPISGFAQSLQIGPGGI